MNSDRFQEIVSMQYQKCLRVLQAKEKEYAEDDDRLHNFKRASDLMGVAPKQALAGMMIKHIVSVYDMCMNDKHYAKELWEEKIGDTINYLFLLKAMLYECGEIVDDPVSEIVDYGLNTYSSSVVSI